MMILSLGHTIMYVQMINLIQCMGNLALMPKLCGKYPILGDFLMIFWDILSPDNTQYPTPDAL